MKQRESTISVHNSSIRQKNNTIDLVDRISDLPNFILGAILSFLPTKNAVSTSILSKRWKHVWVIVPSLDFCNQGRFDEQDEGEDMKFVRFVKHVLLLHDVGSINKFRLVWNPMSISSSDTNSWIVNAITSNVRELFLSVGTPFGPYDLPQLFKMPMCVWSCDSLQSLELSGGIFVSDTIEICFPRLESLKLEWIVFESEEAFKKLISGCLMLKYLNIYLDIDEMTYSFRKDYDFMYTISSTSLRRLELFFDHQVHLPGENIGCSLKLEASSLEYLKLVGYISAIFVEKSLSSLVEAEFRIQLLETNFPEDDFQLLEPDFSEDDFQCLEPDFPEDDFQLLEPDFLEDDFQLLEPDFPGEAFCNSLVKAVRAFNCAKALTFSTDAMRALSCATISLSTEFKRLVKLKTSIGCCDCWSLRDFIQSSDNLEVLTIYQRPNRNHEHVESNWVDVQHLRCLSNRLKAVILNGYHGLDNECEMISYMLRNGSALEIMKISCGISVPVNTKLELLQKISKFPRKSPTCQVEFF